MRPDTKNWLKSATYDFETAQHMLSTGRYIYVVFFCHLIIEKTLKALVTEVRGKPSPRSHDLIYLAKRAGLTFEPYFYEFISKLKNASIPTRYPTDIERVMVEYNKEVVTSYLK